MDKLEKTIEGLDCCIGHGKPTPRLGNEPRDCENCPYSRINGINNMLCFRHLQRDALEILKAQEARVLKIKEMAFLEIAVFIETNGDLEGKGTDLFLAIPYIYAVSQNMLDGYIAFVDGNTDVYDLQAIDYGKCWRCWTSRPTDEQRKAVKWD